MNKWKIAFWICFSLLIVISLYAAFVVTDKSVTIAFMRIGYAQTENDLKTVSAIVGNTDLSKTQIKAEILKDSIYEYVDFKRDTVELQKVNLIFHENKLQNIVTNY